LEISPTRAAKAVPKCVGPADTLRESLLNAGAVAAETIDAEARTLPKADRAGGANVPSACRFQISDLLKEARRSWFRSRKNPSAKKARVSQATLPLPGPLPGLHADGESQRRLAQDQLRRRTPAVKRIINSERENQTGGFIVRTAAEHVSEEDLRNDIRFLLNLSGTRSKAALESARRRR